MEHLKRVLKRPTCGGRHRGDDGAPISTGAGEYDLADDQIFSDYEKELFSHVVEMAEKEGKPVELLVVPAVNPFDAMAQAANS
jgi:hypothetical protein